MADLLSKNLSDSTPAKRGPAIVKQASFIVLHVVPLILATTAFTLITAPLGYSSLNWNYFAYSHRDGFGYAYQSDYSVGQVLTYLLAYASGVILYPLLTRPRLLSRLATLLCLVGVISFAIELSHWVIDHHMSWIASFPIVVLPIAIWTIVISRQPKPQPAVN